ncbi:vWA domain-containing protein [Aureibacillus halotolerans]|uniref:Ca-activated chloride channel family protein n=1 Tax=Aureibacillus halotolerans TaxID=1508390 RepID=A0A4R6U8V9_9BACI|nr:VWA domain-containing protein [Aureibacillus halotolerans]TDQ43030.1 Ca-activated chloride channel family protein [Aureibacillus halotolerans]
MKRKKESSVILSITCILLLALSACAPEKTGVSQSTAAKSNSVVEDTSDRESTEEEPEPIENQDVFDKETEIDWRVPDKETLVNNPEGTFAGAPFEENREEIIAVLEQFPHEDDVADGREEILKQLLLLFAEDYEEPFPEWEELKVDPPTIYNGKRQLTANLNVEILLDASGSMIEEVDGDSKMVLAKEAIQQFAGNLPEEANVSLRVYGHEGTTAFEDKVMSCESSEEMYELQPYEKSTLSDSLEQFKPSGWTPMAKALEDAKKDLEGLDKEANTNLIFLVSDGIETCGGDPVSAAKELKDSDIQPLVNVIGFNVDEEGQQQLKDVAKSADGVFAYVEDQEALAEQFDQADEIAAQWEKWRSETVAEINEVSSKRKERLDTVMSSWDENWERERNNINEALAYLSEEGKIDRFFYNLEMTSRDIGFNAVIKQTRLSYSSDQFFEKLKADQDVMHENLKRTLDFD